MSHSEVHLSSDFNKFLSIQLKIQKARDGFEVKMISPIAFDALIYLTYDLEQFVIKPTGAYPAFDAIVIPILSITTMTTSDPSASLDLNPAVHLRLSLPPFAVSFAFPADCRSFGQFTESLEFLRLTLSPSTMTHSQREIYQLRKTNEELSNAVTSLQTTRLQQEQIIQELSKILNSLTQDQPQQHTNQENPKPAIHEQNV